MISHVPDANGGHTILSRAPLVEAMVELHFAGDALPRSFGSIPGQLYDRVQGDYPEFEDLQSVELPFVAEFDRVVRHRYWTADRSRLLQVGRGVFTVNSLRYAGYDDFRAHVAAVLPHALDLLGPPKDGIVQYINKIAIGEWEVAKVLQWGPAVPAGWPALVTQKVEARFAPLADTGSLNVTWASPIDDTPGRVLLQLAVAHELKGNSASEDLLQWIDRAHGRVEQSFFGILTDEFVESTLR